MSLLVLDGSAISHLSGALFGLLFAIYWKKGINLTSIAEKMIYKKTIKPEPHSKYSFDTCSDCDGGSNTATSWKTSKKTIKKEKPLEVDEVLDKISKSGMKSLTKKELDFLKRKGR